MPNRMKGRSTWVAPPISWPVSATHGTGTGDVLDEVVALLPEDDGSEPEPEDDIINDYGQIGLLGALPKGTTVYTGDMGGYPIEFTITKKPETGELSALYKNVNYGTTMKMVGESLPAQGGEISFFGEENGRQWSFDLDGDADNITGTASGSNNYQFNVKLKRK